MNAVSKRFSILCLALTLGAAVAAGATGCASRQTNSAIGDEVLTARVEAALAGAADVNGAAITVHTRRGVVTLTGRVASPTEQQSVGAIVRAIPGVSDVRFSLSIEEKEDGEELGGRP